MQAQGNEASGLMRLFLRSNIVGFLALFVALGGGAYAVTIKKNSVRSSSIKDGQVLNADIGDGAVTASKIAAGVSPTGPPGPPGQNGTNGTAPAGGVMFFNLASCPSGWTELTTGRGRYIVGRPSGGTLAGTAGTALTNLENRPVGQHNHPITDPGHTHTTEIGIGVTDDINGLGLDLAQQAGELFFDSDSATTGITVNNAGSVAGTNAPYLQLLVCQKT